MPPVTQALLITNVAVFLLQSVTGGLLEAWFALWPPGHGFGIWQLLTYGFLHGGRALFSRLLPRLRGLRRALPARGHRGHGRAALPDPRRLRRGLRVAARLRDVFPAAHGRADLSADPDAGADLRDRVRRARARARGHRHRGGRGALRAPRRNARGLARDSVPSTGLSFYS